MPSVKSAIAPSKSTLACFPAARVVQASASQFAFNARRTEPYVEPSSAAILRRLMPCACSSATLPRCQIFRGAPWDKFLPLLDNRVLPALAAAACSRRARATPNRTRSASIRLGQKLQVPPTAHPHDVADISKPRPPRAHSEMPAHLASREFGSAPPTAPHQRSSRAPTLRSEEH